MFKYIYPICAWIKYKGYVILPSVADIGIFTNLKKSYLSINNIIKKEHITIVITADEYSTPFCTEYRSEFSKEYLTDKNKRNARETYKYLLADLQIIDKTTPEQKK